MKTKKVFVISNLTALFYLLDLRIFQISKNSLGLESLDAHNLILAQVKTFVLKEIV